MKPGFNVKSQKPYTSPLIGKSALSIFKESMQISLNLKSMFFFAYEGQAEWLTIIKVCHKHLEWWQILEWLIHTDSVPAHTPLSVQKCSAKLASMNSCFQKWICSYRLVISWVLLKFRKNHRLSYKQFQAISPCSMSSRDRNTRAVT